MPRRLRILQTGPSRYVIQEKGWLFWKDLTKTGGRARNWSEIDELRCHYYTNAGDAIKSANSFLRQDLARQPFNSKVVWDTRRYE